MDKQPRLAVRLEDMFAIKQAIERSGYKMQGHRRRYPGVGRPADEETPGAIPRRANNIRKEYHAGIIDDISRVENGASR